MIAKVLNCLLWFGGVLMVMFISLGVFGLVSHGPEFYVTFAFGIVYMSGIFVLTSFVEQLKSELGGQTDTSDNFEAPAVSSLRWASIKATLAITATISGLIGLGYFRLNINDLVMNAPFFDQTAINMGYLIIFSIITLTWLHWGWLLSLLSALSIAYFFFGDLIPIALLRHPGYDEAFIMNYVALNTNQGFFQFSGVAADDIYLMTYFGVSLLGVGMLRMMIEVGRAAGNHVPGGAALPAVLGSSAIGSVMGQAVSNVVLTGRLTIPMMKRYGYHPAMAGAIEATASSVGQLMPPVLGLAGFLIASSLGVPYVTVALAAIIPAFLFIFGVAVSIAVYAMRENIPKLQEVVNYTLIWRMLPTLVVSLGLVVWLLLGFRSPGFAGLVGIGSALFFALFQGRYRPSREDLKNSFREGMYLTTILCLLILAIGPLGQVMVTTNLSGRLSTLLATVLPDVELLLLAGAMVLSIFLGMGLPTPIAYVVASLAMVPFLQEIGVPAFHAHFFVFYFAVFSTLTPPIAVSVLAASKLASASFYDTAVNAMKIAGTTFIIPFAFVFNPDLLSFPDLNIDVIIPIVEVLFMQTLVAFATYGYCFKWLSKVERWAFSVWSVFGFWALTSNDRSVTFDVILLSSALLMIYWCWFSSRKMRKSDSLAQLAE
jgi:TRAP transporter 4TM/12TM fusion protein